VLKAISPRLVSASWRNWPRWRRAPPRPDTLGTAGRRPLAIALPFGPRLGGVCTRSNSRIARDGFRMLLEYVSRMTAGETPWPPRRSRFATRWMHSSISATTYVRCPRKPASWARPGLLERDLLGQSHLDREAEPSPDVAFNELAAFGEGLAPDIKRNPLGRAATKSMTGEPGESIRFTRRRRPPPTSLQESPGEPDCPARQRYLYLAPKAP